MSFVLVAMKVCVTLCVLSWYSSGVLKLMDTYFRNEFTKYLKKDLESKANYPRGLGLVASSSGVLVSAQDLHQPSSKRPFPSSTPKRVSTREELPEDVLSDYGYEYSYEEYGEEEAGELEEMDEVFTNYYVLHEETSKIVKEGGGEYLFTASRLDSPEIDESVSLRTSSPSYLSSHGAHAGGSMTMTATILTTCTTPQQTSTSGEGNQNEGVSEEEHVNHHHKPLPHPSDLEPGPEARGNDEKVSRKKSRIPDLSPKENKELKDHEEAIEEATILQDMCLMKKNEDKNFVIQPSPPSSLSPSSLASGAELPFCQQDKLEYLDAQSDGNFPSNWGIEISGEECKEYNHRPDSIQHSSPRIQIQQGMQLKDEEYESCNEPPLLSTQGSQPENQILPSQQIIRPASPPSPPFLLLKARGKGVITASPESKLITFLFLLISAISFYTPLFLFHEN